MSLSKDTAAKLIVVDEIAATLPFDLGRCVTHESQGDSAWFVFTLGNSQNLYILICTPTCILAEYTLEGFHNLSVIDNVGD